MARHERAPRSEAGEALPGVVKLRRDKDGKLQVIDPGAPTKATTEARPKPAQADDPRTAPFRGVPPVGGA